MSEADAPAAIAGERGSDQKKHDRGRSASRDDTKARGKDRETRLPACEACRTRKVKCDALLPACTPCRKSGRECVGRDKIPNVSRGLVYELQQKVKDLESRLALASSSNAVSNSRASSRNGHLQHDHGRDSSDSDNASESQSSRRNEPPKKRRKGGRNGHSTLPSSAHNTESDDESAASEIASSPPAPTDPSPNDFAQQTSTILESLSSDLTGSAHQQQSTTKSTTQTLDNDEASALAALTRQHRSRTRSPHRLKRRSSSNASRHLDEGNSYFPGASRIQHPSASSTYKAKSRPSRLGTISAHDRSFFDRLIARYLTYMNTTLPVISEVRLWELASSVYADDQRSRLSAYDTMPPPPQPSSAVSDRISLSRQRYVVLMSLAIALASLGRSHHFSPELRRLGHQYWADAQALFPLFFRSSDLDKLRATLLLLQYALLVPTAGSVWELSGAAIRLVTELNLHVDREHDSAANLPFSKETIDLRRRLFWTTYCLDRSLAVALARPPGLSDAWIHVQLPSLLSDADLVSKDREPSSSAEESLRINPLKQLFRSHINLRRVQSEILCRLHSVNPRDYSLDNDGISLSQPGSTRPSLALVMEVGPPTPNIEWQSRMVEKLVEWRSEYDRIRLAAPAWTSSSQGEGMSSTATPFITRDWIDLNHNLAISLLFRPSPNNPRPDAHGLQQAFIASGRAMKIYKSMHRSSTINFPWLATHHLFISGLTHLNALEKLTRMGVSCPSPVVEVVFNVQSCASTLEALTSRDDGYGTKIRDTFDAAASAVLRSVLEPSLTRQPASSSETSAADLASVEEFIRGSSSGFVRQSSTPMPEARRTSHHDAMLQHVTQHPTWLSDSTWSSINALDAAPPPGSTIFVAAPPRTARYNSLVPTLSERTTQSPQNGAGVHHAASSTLPAATPSPRSFALQAYTNLTPTSINFAATNSYQMNGSGDNARSNDAAPTAAEAQLAENATTSTFGFHNWLLQPYEGGADGLGQFGSMDPNGTSALGATNAMLFDPSPSGSDAGNPFQNLYTAENRANTGAYLAQPVKAAETDASTLLDFLSMLPASNSAVDPLTTGAGAKHDAVASSPSHQRA